MKKAKNTLTREARKMYRRIKRTRNKAQWVGMLYLLATIIVAALAVLPTLNIDYVNVIGNMKPVWADLDGLGANVATISRVLYVIILLGAVISVFKALGKIGALYKKKASRTYGFNRNVYAMKALEKNFSRTFGLVVINYFLIVLLNNAWGNTAWTEIGGILDALKANSAVLANFYFLDMNIAGIQLTNALAIVAVGLVFQTILAYSSAKASLFVAEEGVGVYEEKRMIGRFAPAVRNLFQKVFAIVLGVLVLETNATTATFVADALTGTVAIGISAILDVVLLLCWMVCIAHAFNPTEYNADGAQGRGMKNYGFFMFVAFAVSAYAYYTAHGTDFSALNNDLLLVAVTFVACFIELIVKSPRYVEEVETDEDDVEEEPAVADEELDLGDDVDWRYFFSDEFAGTKNPPLVIR